MEISLARIIMEFAYRVADRIQARAILIYVDAESDMTLLSESRPSKDVILVTRRNDIPAGDFEFSGVLKMPDLELTRFGQIKIAIIKGIATGLFKKQDKVVCLTGIPGFGYLDCVVIIDIGKEFEILASDNALEIFEGIHAEVFEAILNIALELGAKGREGRSVGTIFILGDHENVIRFTRQMIINPFAGHSEKERNILNPSLKETIREFSSLDGAFVIRGDGVVLTAGSYLNAAMEGHDIPQGLGSRHLAAAGITNLTNAVAMVVSESTGTVRVFKKGRMLLSIEKAIE
jgi:DNA integrity scanning protein DisA with diadenylate cyclase activity